MRRSVGIAGNFCGIFSERRHDHETKTPFVVLQIHRRYFLPRRPWYFLERMGEPAPPPAKKRGRPPLDRADPSVKLSLTITASTFDHLCQDATANGLSLREYARRKLRSMPHTRLPNDPT